MGSLFAPMHLLVIILVLVLLFGRGRIADSLEELGRGLKSFKKGFEDDDKAQHQKTEQKAKPFQNSFTSSEEQDSTTENSQQ